MPYPGTLTAANLTGLVKQYSRNISNAAGGANVTSGTASTDIVLPLIDNGSNKFQTATVTTGKLSFDATFNSNKGGLITDQINNDAELFARLTVVNLSTPTDAVFKMFLVFNKATPGTGVKISSSPINVRADVEQTINFKAFLNGIQAVYPMMNLDNTRDFRISGYDVTILENQD